jgi:hypothetical protein
MLLLVPAQVRIAGTPALLCVIENLRLMSAYPEKVGGRGRGAVLPDTSSSEKL